MPPSAMRHSVMPARARVPLAVPAALLAGLLAACSPPQPPEEERRPEPRAVDRAEPAPSAQGEAAAR